MSTQNDGGPAFPQTIAFNPNGEAVTAGMYFTEGPGMTLRDYFAAKAMLGYCSCASTVDSWSVETTAEQAYRIADAMLAERNK